MAQESIPRKVVYRLSVYHRNLERLRTNGVETVSSEALAASSGVKPSQLRKDLACFGQFGKRGKGYNVQNLTAELHHALGTTHLQPVILVGVGNLGAALLHYGGFAREGFEIIGAFDQHPQDRIAASTHKIKLRPMTDLPAFIAKHCVKMAILTVPGTVAQEVTNQLVAHGIQAILNFAPIILQVPDGVVTNNVDLALELENLSYFTR